MKATLDAKYWQGIVFGEFVRMSKDTLQTFYCDYYMDAQYLARAKAPCNIWYAFSEHSTQLYVDESCCSEAMYRKLLSEYDNLYVCSVVPQNEREVEVEIVKTSA